jgi:NADH:ubiquinone oxidoreductase subunit 4 (subunit M)
LFKFCFRVVVVLDALSLVGGLLVSLFCIRQTDLKSLIAYSSVAHVSMVIGGIVTLSYGGVCRSFAIQIYNFVFDPLWILSLYVVMQVPFKRQHVGAI